AATAWSGPKSARPTGTATSATFSPTAPPRRAACATASTPRPCASSPSTTWSARVTAPTASYSTRPTTPGAHHDDQRDREGHPGRRLLLGRAGSGPQAPRRALDQGRLHRPRRAERDLPDPRPTRGGPPG